MHQLTTIGNTAKTMTSIDLVDWINRERCHEVNSTLPVGHSSIPAMLRHDNFMAKLEKHPGIDSPKFLGHVEIEGPNGAIRKSKCYHLPRRECGLMIMSESLLVQTRMYDRLAELEKTPTQALALPQDYIQALESLLASKKSEQLAIEQLALAAPAIKHLQAVQVSRDDFTFQEMAHILQEHGYRLGRNRLMDVLRRAGVLTKASNLPMQDYRERGYFRVVESIRESSTGRKHVDLTTYVTGKGHNWLTKAMDALLLKSEKIGGAA